MEPHLCQTLVCISVSFSFFPPSVFSGQLHRVQCDCSSLFCFIYPWTLASCMISRGKFSAPQSQYILRVNFVSRWGCHCCISWCTDCMFVPWKRTRLCFKQGACTRSGPTVPPAVSGEQREQWQWQGCD